MEREMEGFERDLKVVKESHGNQVLKVVQARGYLAKLFANARVARYLDPHHSDIFHELKTMTEGSALEK
jgi:hypothetical protein